MPQRRPTLSIYLLSHVLFGKPVSTHRVKPEGMLFRDMLQSMQTASTALAIEALRVPPMRMTLGRLGAKTSRYASFLKKAPNIQKLRRALRLAYLGSGGFGPCDSRITLGPTAKRPISRCGPPGLTIQKPNPLSTKVPTSPFGPITPGEDEPVMPRNV